MKCSIRDVLFVTVIVALALGWWLERSSARRAREEATKAASEAESHRAIVKALTKQLQSKNPAAKIDIRIHGGSSTTSLIYASPNSSAPHPDPPME